MKEQPKSPRWQSSVNPRLLQRPKTAPTPKFTRPLSDSDSDSEGSIKLRVTSAKIRPKPKIKKSLTVPKDLDDAESIDFEDFRPIKPATPKKVTINEEIKLPESPKQEPIEPEQPPAVLNIEYNPIEISPEKSTAITQMDSISMAKDFFLEQEFKIEENPHQRRDSVVCSLPKFPKFQRYRALQPISGEVTLIAKSKQTMDGQPETGQYEAGVTPETQPSPLPFETESSEIRKASLKWQTVRNVIKAAKKLGDTSKAQPEIKRKPIVARQNTYKPQPVRRQTIRVERERGQTITRKSTLSSVSHLQLNSPGRVLKTPRKVHSPDGFASNSSVSSDSLSESVESIAKPLPIEEVQKELESLLPKPKKVVPVNDGPNPMTMLRSSMYNLFSTTAGPFRGPGDAYHKFILGGKSIRLGAKKLEQLKFQEVDSGKLDQVLVHQGNNRFAALTWNSKAVASVREKYKLNVREQIQTKVSELEKTRAYIISTMASLRAYKELLASLMQQNDELRVEHKQVLDKINKDVSTALENNETFFQAIHDKSQQVKNHRKELVVELSHCMKECEHKQKKLQLNYDQKLAHFNEKLSDYKDLEEFAKADLQDPLVSFKLISIEQDSQQARLLEMKQVIASYEEKFQTQEREMKEYVDTKSAEIIDKSISKFNKYFETLSKNQTALNLSLKKELNIQRELCEQFEKDIEVALDKRKELKREMKECTDRRRDVLDLKKCMTCTPEMDIVLSA